MPKTKIPTENEILSQRTKYSQTFSNDDGTSFVSVSFLKEKFWLDINDESSETKYKLIETDFTESNLPEFRWTNKSNEFSFYFKENLNTPNAIVFNNKTASIGLQSKYMAYYEMDATSDVIFDSTSSIELDSTSFQILEIPSDSTGSLIEQKLEIYDSTGHIVHDATDFNEFKLVYNDFYPNCDFIYGSHRYGIKEYIRLKTKDNLPDPTSLGMDSTNVYLMFLTEIDVDGIINMEDEKGKKVKKNKNLEKVKFKNYDGELAFEIPELFGWEQDIEDIVDIPNSIGNTIYPLKKRIVTIDDIMYVMHGISYDELMQTSNVVPMILDTTVVKHIDDSTRDGYGWGFDQSWITNISVLSTGNLWSQPMGFWLRFDPVSVPQGSTITSATISWFVSNPADTLSAFPLLRGYDQDDVSQDPINWYEFGIAAYGPGAQTTAYFPAAFALFSSGWNIPDVTSIVQEIVDRPGWASGNGMAFTCAGSSTGETTAGIYDYWYSGSTADAFLTVNYSSGVPLLEATGWIGMGGTTEGRSINLRLEKSATAQISLNDSDARTLAGIASGQISINDFHGK